jgi:hypothetical protein
MEKEQEKEDDLGGETTMNGTGKPGGLSLQIPF